MKMEMYTAGVPGADLSDWVQSVTAASRAHGIQVYQSPIPDKLESPLDASPVVSDELCAPPSERIEFCGVHEESLRAFAYKAYQSRLGEGCNVCLYNPAKRAIFLPFDGKLIAKRAAHLYFRDGTSDKVYHLYLAAGLDLECYTVISRYGRRGRNLQQAAKPFDDRLDEAEREWDRLHNDKIEKGYQVGHPTTPGQLELGMCF